MIQDGNHEYLKKLDENLVPIFNKYNFELYNLSDMNKFNGNDSEMLDGMHASESIYQRMLLYMLQQKSVLNNVCDSNDLRNALEHRVNRYTVYDY